MDAVKNTHSNFYPHFFKNTCDRPYFGPHNLRKMLDNALQVLICGWIFKKASACVWQHTCFASGGGNLETG